MQTFLSVQSLTKQIGQQPAVQSVSFELSRFQKLAIAGETGSGKSTLLKMIGGLVQPDYGGVYYEGKRVAGPNEQLIPGHPKIGYLSQHFELRNHYLVQVFMAMASLLPVVEASEIYSVCQVDHLLRRWTHELSGGEKQRIALAKVLVTSPGLLLLDEPFSNLDLPHKFIMRQVLADVSNQLGISCILVSHDAQDLLSWADTIMILHDGSIVQQGATDLVYRRPVNAYAASLLGTMQLLPNTVVAAMTGTSKEQLPGHLFLRPEWIELSADAGAAGIVTNSSFCGNFYLVQVSCNGQEVLVQVQKNPPLPGESVYLSANPADLWSW